MRNLTTGETTTASTALVKADVILDNLVQDDPRWTVDSRYKPGKDRRWGYNARISLGAALMTDFDVETESPFAVTPHRYQITVAITPASGSAFRIAFQFEPIPSW